MLAVTRHPEFSEAAPGFKVNFCPVFKMSWISVKLIQLNLKEYAGKCTKK